MRAASSRRAVGRALTRKRTDLPRRGYGERRRRIGQVTAALSATVLAIVLILETVGGFGSGVALPPAVVFNSTSSARTAVAPVPGISDPSIPGAAIVNSVPKVIEGGESEDGSKGNGSSNESVTTTDPPSDPQVTASVTPSTVAQETTTTRAPKQGSGGEDGGTHHRSGGSGDDGGGDGASGASGATGGGGGSGGSGDR